jgi:hypothetical protein
MSSKKPEVVLAFASAGSLHGLVFAPEDVSPKL